MSTLGMHWISRNEIIDMLAMRGTSGDGEARGELKPLGNTCSVLLAAVAAGLINSLAGGGGLITFPLLALVVPPVVADATRAPLPSFPLTPAPCGVPAASCARYAGCGSGCSSSPALWAGWWERCCWSGQASGTCCSSYRGWCSA